MSTTEISNRANTARRVPGKRRRAYSGRIAAVVILSACAAYLIWSDYRTDRYAEACAAASRAQDWARLDEVATAWSNWDPDSGDAWFFQAEAALNRKDPERAAQCFARVPLSHSSGTVALDRRTALLFGALNRPFDAVQACERVLQRDPAMTVARNKVIFFAAATLQRAIVVEMIRESIALGCARPEDWVYILTADGPLLPQARALNTYWQETHPECPLFCVADGVRGGADTLLDRFPHHPEALAVQVERGIAQADPGRVADLLSRLPPQAVQDWRFLRYQGWLHASAGELERAEKALRDSLALHPMSWKTHEQLAALLQRVGKRSDAERHERLSAEGRDLCEAVELLASPSDVPPEIVGRIAAYADQCNTGTALAGPRPSALPTVPGF